MGISAVFSWTLWPGHDLYMAIVPNGTVLLNLQICLASRVVLFTNMFTLECWSMDAHSGDAVSALFPL